jgi:hypothetical protein
MSPSSARVRLYVTYRNRKDFYAAMAPARDDAKDSFVFMDTEFSFGERNTVYTEIGIDDEAPSPITEGFCRVLRVVITTNDAPPLGSTQAGRYNARTLRSDGTSAVVMMNDVEGVSVTGTNLMNARQAFKRIMRGGVRPSTPAT